MAHNEEYGDFESHFLDSMLEVQMTEEDGEVKISQAEETQEGSRVDLPPTPRFDLQTETIKYKDVYTKTIVPVSAKNILKPVPAQVTGNTITLPCIQAPRMIVIPSNLLKSTNVITKSNHVDPAVQTAFVTKQGSVLEGLLTRTDGAKDKIGEFLRGVFKHECMKVVYSKQSSPCDISQTSPEEEDYYKAAFKDISYIQHCKLHCTICGHHLGCSKDADKRIHVHNMLKVLTCSECYKFYGDGNFPCDDGDHCEIYCRWCGQGGALICCSFCPKVFCKKCIRQNFGRKYLKSIEKASDWACFICAQKPLWPHRAVCRALMEYINRKRINPKLPAKDTSTCCKSPNANKKIITEVDRNKIFLSGGQVQMNRKDQANQVDMKDNVVLPIVKSVPSDLPIIVKTYGRAISRADTLNDKKEAPISISKTQSLTITPKISTNSSAELVPQTGSVPGMTITRTSATIYNEPTTTTTRQSQTAKTHAENEGHSGGQGHSNTKVCVADSGNINLNSIPVAKIPDNAQGVILRLNFPDNKVQLVRLITEGKDRQDNMTFPMPTFENGENLDFLEECLEDSFKLTKMLYERLMKIKEKLHNKSKSQKHGVYKSSVKKLSFIYEKARELMKELDDNLLGNYEKWKMEKEQDNDVRLIEISDEERPQVEIEPVQRLSLEKKGKVAENARECREDVSVILSQSPPARNLRSTMKRKGTDSLPLPQKKILLTATPEVNKGGKKSIRTSKRLLVENEKVEKGSLTGNDRRKGLEVKVNGDKDASELDGSLNSVIEIKEEKIDGCNDLGL